MKKFSTWMILSIGVIFWGLRIAAVYTETMGIDFLIKPLDTNTVNNIVIHNFVSIYINSKKKNIGCNNIYCKLLGIFWNGFHTLK